MSRRFISSISIICAISFAISSTPLADPCGMVPPIYPGDGPAITRVGAQRTYVFFKNGIESFVIRPGFRGKVDNFGMLIPFPTPPAIRKMPDDIFSQIAAAVDPPEVLIDLRPRKYYKRRRFKGMKRSPKKKSKKLAIHTVRVLRQEAVGMYQVAVLQAGSPKALKRWMDRNGYKYPKGMDKACLDYIKAGWCFVAVKTRVAGKKGVSPRPGMRKAKLKFPKGGSFTGSVQAMGFRFRTKRLVVPMRLSAFNKGRLRNIVYLLTTGPRMIRSIPKEYVRRQLSGRELYRNVTQLLPLRVIGGTAKDIPRHRWQYLQRRRNPTPHNGLAKELFASDLLAVGTNRLALPHEEQKKVLLRIGEQLRLRGKRIDRLNRQALVRERRMTVAKGLSQLKKMTLTIVDGDFPRDVLSRENLSFAAYRMPAKLNHANYYDARGMRVRTLSLRRGVLTRWQGPRWSVPKKPVEPEPQKPGPYQTPQGIKAFVKLLKKLENGKTAGPALTALVKAGKKALPYLLGEALEGHHLSRRGWSIVGLVRLGGATVKKRLPEVRSNSKNPPLVRTWSAAAQIKLSANMNELMPLKPLIRSYPSTRRPFTMRLFELLGKGQKSLGQLLDLAVSDYTLRKALASRIMAFGAKSLIKEMVSSKNNGARRLAAGYIGGLFPRNPKKVMKALVRAYRFRPNAKQVPWIGGALFVPGISWGREEARQLVGHLIAWMLWCDKRGMAPEQKQIHNNIRSLSLARAAGYRSPGWRRVGVQRWLHIWGQTVGCKGLVRLLKRQRVRRDARYNTSLPQLGCQ